MKAKNKLGLVFFPHLIGRLALLILSEKSDFYIPKTKFLKKESQILKELTCLIP